ncbi:D-3-phosphoglycerate dehydrogenase [Parapedobacter luteus]|uniref:D-3-phosphoglycerate dehydrogenase n=1 Tax=Parapedobacter luteus TaxID=623280 RepID=A0A1T5DFP5_9SPHI|nr:phosphoglycerate dehydrogenase [Parapedobacter luteus]SKB70519.1 D-3-phosphoglycerate dehydrogenase [Parapedobacter luteus]
MKVLITCPPMLRRIEEFRHLFSAKNIELVTPNVVQVLTEQELIELVPTVDAWIIGDDPATASVFKAGKAGKLKAAVKWGVGIDNVDFAACKDLNIPIANTPQMFGREVADLAIAYLLGLARETYFIDREVRKGNWVKPSGMSVSGKTVAVIGLGDIGRATIRRLQGFDVKINAYDPFTFFSPEEVGANEILSFPEKLEEADFVILTCALTPSSCYMINKDSIALMKDHVRLINVARGPLINEQDLIAALKSGKVYSAALDVFEQEPLTPTNELRSFEQCIFGTHNGSNTVEGVRRASYKAIELLFDFLKIS